MKKFYVFNLIVFIFLLTIFITGSTISNEITYTFGGNSYLNPISGKTIVFHGFIMQIFSGVGMIIQIIFVNTKLIKEDDC